MLASKRYLVPKWYLRGYVGEIFYLPVQWRNLFSVSFLDFLQGFAFSFIFGIFYRKNRLTNKFYVIQFAKISKKGLCMQSLILEADETVLEHIKSFLSLIPKEKLKVIDPFEVGFVSDAEKKEILEILQNSDTKEMVDGSKRTYQI